MATEKAAAEKAAAEKAAAEKAAAEKAAAEKAAAEKAAAEKAAAEKAGAEKAAAEKTVRAKAKPVKASVRAKPQKASFGRKAVVVATGVRKIGGLGKLDGSSVTRVLRRRAGAFRACYERRRKVNPNLKGKVVIRFKIGTAGRIASIKVTGNSTGDSGVASCITGKVRSWRFPAPLHGSVTFTYPIVLSTR